MEFIKKVWNWIVYSSANPEKISTTIKGLAVFVPTAVLFFGLVHVNVTADSLLGLFDAAAAALTSIIAAVGAVLALWGAVRKIFKTMEGTNEVINESNDL